MATAKRISPGSIVGVIRAPYDHYGIVMRGGEVIHYAPAGSDIPGDVRIVRTSARNFARDAGSIVTGGMQIRQTPAEYFLRDASSFWTMSVPSQAAARRMLEARIDAILKPAAEEFSGIVGMLANAGFDAGRRMTLNNMLENYHLYTLAETQERARSHLGEGGYNMATSNCEHFAFWCRTGLSTSQQVGGLLFGGASLVTALFTSAFASRLEKVFDPAKRESLGGVGLFTKSPLIPARVLLPPAKRAAKKRPAKLPKGD
jgi:hypothetical protein